VLGGEEVRAAIKVRTELDAVVSYFAQRAKREDLKAAGVREQSARPTHESVKSAHAADCFVAGAEIEVVSVAEDDFCAERFERILRDGFNGALRADGHKDRGFDGLVREDEAASTAAGGGFGKNLELQAHH
jgi:hypothetical protein